MLKDGKEVTVLNPAQVCAFGCSLLASLWLLALSPGLPALQVIINWSRGKPGNKARKNRDTRVQKAVRWVYTRICISVVS